MIMKDKMAIERETAARWRWIGFDVVEYENHTQSLFIEIININNSNGATSTCDALPGHLFGFIFESTPDQALHKQSTVKVKRLSL